MENEDIRKRIHEFPRWHYQFEINGCITPIYDKSLINRHNQRKKYFFDPLVNLCNGSLTGLNVLDLGCNAGFWSLHAVESKCSFVLGIDGRKMHIDEANFIFEAKKIDTSKYRFINGNVLKMDLSDFGSFEVVFCLGLLYHVNNPIFLLETISSINTDLLIIDTTIYKRTSDNKDPVFLLQRENLDDPRMAVESPFVFIPTIEAIIFLLKRIGYKGVVLKPQFDDYEGALDFKEGHRKALICSKTRDLSGIFDLAESVF